MSGQSIAARLGLGASEARDDAFAWRCLAVILLLCTLSFAAFYPNVSTNDDEAMYLLQAKLMLQGRSAIDQIDPLSGEEVRWIPSTYTPGLAGLMAPFVHVFGWRGGYLIPWLGLLGAVLFTGLALRHEGRSPIFALIVLGFAPTLVMSRVAMSDVPSAAVVALALLCFFRGIDGSARWWLASGFIAGSSLTLRATNPMLLAPLFAGTVIRREPRCWALVVGGLAGLAVRVAVMSWYFGDPLYERAQYRFAPDTLFDRLPYYLFGLLVLAPGGLLLAVLYRGRRRPEVIVTIFLFVAFYLFDVRSTETAGVAKRTVLLLRYVIPLLPLLALACAESAPRLWRNTLATRASDTRVTLERRASQALLASVVGIAAAGVLVHPTFHFWARTQAEIRDAIERTVPLDAVLLTNFWATRKFVQEEARRFTMMELAREVWADPQLLRPIAERYPETFVVLLDRNDSPYWREDAAGNAELLEALDRDGIPLELVLDRQASSTDHLRVWRVALDSEQDERQPTVAR